MLNNTCRLWEVVMSINPVAVKDNIQGRTRHHIFLNIRTKMQQDGEKLLGSIWQTCNLVDLLIN